MVRAFLVLVCVTAAVSEDGPTATDPTPDAVSERSETGACTAQIMVDVSGCTVSSQRSEGDVGFFATRDRDCDSFFWVCGEQFPCNCRGAWADAGVVWPDGG